MTAHNYLFNNSFEYPDPNNPSWPDSWEAAEGDMDTTWELSTTHAIHGRYSMKIANLGSASFAGIKTTSLHHLEVRSEEHWVISAHMCTETPGQTITIQIDYLNPAYTLTTTMPQEFISTTTMQKYSLYLEVPVDCCAIAVTFGIADTGTLYVDLTEANLLYPERDIHINRGSEIQIHAKDPNNLWQPVTLDNSSQLQTSSLVINEETQSIPISNTPLSKNMVGKLFFASTDSITLSSGEKAILYLENPSDSGKNLYINRIYINTPLDTTYNILLNPTPSNLSSQDIHNTNLGSANTSIANAYYGSGITPDLTGGITYLTSTPSLELTGELILAENNSIGLIIAADTTMTVQLHISWWEE